MSGIKKNPFEKFVKVLKEMSPELRNNIISAHKRFGELRGYCQAKGYIETLPQLRGIKVIKNTPEVKELKTVVERLKPGRFIWLDIGDTEESLKEKSAENLRKKK